MENASQRPDISKNTNSQVQAKNWVIGGIIKIPELAGFIDQRLPLRWRLAKLGVVVRQTE